MTARPHYVPGDWNVICYICGFTFKASQLRKHWKGYYVCPKDWEPRHPQDFVKAPQPEQLPAWVQSDTTHPQIGVCTPNGRTARPGFAIPGCAIPGFVDPLFDPEITTSI
jgi:hypothetical protein